MLWPLVLLLLCGARESQAADECTSPTSTGVLHGDTIGLLYDDPTLAPVVREAIELWSGCEAFGREFPHLVAGRGGRRPLYVELRKASMTDSCGWFSGSRVVLFRSARTEGGELRPCGSLAHNLAHELGHVFGLIDSPRRPRCRGHIMARLEASNLFSRRVQALECRVVGERWLTFAERTASPRAPMILELAPALDRRR